MSQTFNNPMYTTVTNYLHKFMVQTMRIFSDCIPSYTLQVTQCTPDITAQQQYVHQEYLIHAQCLLVTISMTPLTRFISRMNILPTENTKIISFVPIKPPAMYHNLAPLRKEKNAQLTVSSHQFHKKKIYKYLRSSYATD